MANLSDLTGRSNAVRSVLWKTANNSHRDGNTSRIPRGRVSEDKGEDGGGRQEYAQDQARCSAQAHQPLSQARGIGDQEHKRKYGYDPSDHSDAEPTTAEVLAHVPTRGQGGQVGAQHQRECTER